MSLELFVLVEHTEYYVLHLKVIREDVRKLIESFCSEYDK